MDWYHVLDAHVITEKTAVVAAVEERIEEYILQGIAQEFNPTFNENLVNPEETNTDMNIGNESICSDGNFFPLPDKTEIKIGQFSKKFFS